MATSVYLLHFEGPIDSERHYVGRTADPVNRLHSHAIGEGSLFTKAAYRLGISFVLGNIWDDVDLSYEGVVQRSDREKACLVCEAQVGPEGLPRPAGPPAPKPEPNLGRRCVVPFANGKPCTWVPIPGFPCCANHVVKFMERETGLKAEEIVALILGAPDPTLI